MHPIIEKYIEFNNFGKYLGLNFTIVEPGVVNHYLTITKEHLATPRTAHGGVLAAMMDAVLGVAALSLVCNDNNIVSTVEFKLNYLNPCLLGDKLSGDAIVEHAGKRIIIVSGTIRSINRDMVIAKAIGTFNAYPAIKAGLIL